MSTDLPNKSLSEQLNSGCFCISLDPGMLRQALARELGSPELVRLVEDRCPYLFSSRPVFVSDTQTRRMTKAVRAIETVVALPAYREQVLSTAPTIARHDAGDAKGVFFGYDFHVRDEQIGLIEINTNAGGAMLNALMARAHRACCLDSERLITAMSEAVALEKHIVDMFNAEWQACARTRPLATIAIVDHQPEKQYLYPEFLLFQRLFERNGLKAIITDPSALTLEDGCLRCGDVEIDLVYNRLTDFMLESPLNRTLREAYLEGAIVLTPHPQAHALYADKCNLRLLGDAAALQKLGAPTEAIELLQQIILATEVVDSTNAERLWSSRRQLFFKPTAGFGGKAAYRGDKLTKKVWQEILAGNYVAQKIMTPGERATGSQDDRQSLKFDIRSYVYDGDVQWTAARMYQGQTTNLRTPGGGFAPVFSLADDTVACEIAACARHIADKTEIS